MQKYTCLVNNALNNLCKKAMKKRLDEVNYDILFCLSVLYNYIIILDYEAIKMRFGAYYFIKWIFLSNSTPVP